MKSFFKQFLTKQNEKRKTFFFKLLLSFMVILLLPIAIGGIFFNKIESIMMNNADQAHTAMLEQVRQVVDNRFNEIEDLSLQISHNPKLQKLLTDIHSTNYKYIELVGELAKYHIPSTLVRDYYIYFFERDVILSPAMKADTNLFLSYVRENDSTLFNRLIKERINNYHFMEYFPSENTTNQGVDKNFITFVQTLPYGEKTEFNGVLLIRIDEQQIRDMLKKIEGVNKGSFFIIDENNKILMASIGKGLSSIFPVINANQDIEFTDEHHDMIMSQIISERNNWKYVSVFPKEVVLSQVNTMKTWSLFLVSCLFVLGIFTSYFLANRNYRPIQEVVDAIITKSNPTKINSQNEIEFINQTIIHSYKEQAKLNKIVLQQAPIIKADFISRLVRGHIDVDEITDLSLNLMDVEGNGDFYSILIIQIEDCGYFINDHSETDWTLTRFIIKNLCDELLQQRGFAIEFDREQLIVMINHPNGSVMNKKFETTLINRLRDVIQNRFSIKTSIATSGIHKGIRKISECYREAVLALDYRIIMGENSIINYKDIKEMNSQYEYHFPMETEVQLINFAKRGDFINVEKILDQIYIMNIQAEVATPEIGKCLSFDLLSTWLKLLSTFDYSEKEKLIHEHHPFKIISESKTMKDFHENIKFLFHEFCESVKANQTDHSQAMYQKLILYIEENYHDHMFSLSSMADHFGMNPSYLSTFFKKHSGQNISDMIAQIRVDESKKMLIDQQLTIAEIAQKVGYANSVGLIRVFKKLEGMPPGQYRETLHN